jgi:hypothetical protein
LLSPGLLLLLLCCANQELRTSYPMKPIRPITPLANAAEEVEQQLRKQQLLQQQRRSASTSKMRQKQQPQGWMYGSVRSGGGADQTIPPAAKRLFQDATVRMQRAEQFKEVTEQAERKARSWSAPRWGRMATYKPNQMLAERAVKLACGMQRCRRHAEQQHVLLPTCHCSGALWLCCAGALVLRECHRASTTTWTLSAAAASSAARSTQVSRQQSHV